jgi:D-tyrosyl-tRNA(Tyr) deacylase
MIAVIQRVSSAKVVVDNQTISEIEKGMVVLVGIAQEDNMSDIEWLSKKIIGLRIFADNENKMNENLETCQGEILLISQFTLLASTKKGNRPSFVNAAKPEIAKQLYETLGVTLGKALSKNIKMGIFGADMKVSLTNDGPVTILLDSKNQQ